MLLLLQYSRALASELAIEHCPSMFLYSFILYSVHYIRIENMAIVNSAGMVFIKTIHTIISDLSVSSARIHDAISIGNSNDTALNNDSVNTSISINHCNNTTFNNIHLENVTSMHGIWIYMHVC